MLLVGIDLVLTYGLDFEIMLYLLLLPSCEILSDTHISVVLVLLEHVQLLRLFN